jgi:hypothetical protein
MPNGQGILLKEMGSKVKTNRISKLKRSILKIMLLLES